MDIREMQKQLREFQQVWCVYIDCDGEHDLGGVYESREAAELHKVWQNKRSRYYGKASIAPTPVMPLEFAAKRFEVQPEKDPS